MKKDFHIPFDGYTIAGDCLMEGQIASNVLALHGAGGSNRSRFALLRDFLFEHGIGSCAFDFIGHGQTGGDLSDSSLSQRTEAACTVIKDRKLQEPLVLIGASMGAYTALKISETHPVKALVLFVPAVYAKNAYHLKFDSEFSNAIRQPKSWLTSDAWDIISNNSGNILIIGAEKDEVIPPELEEKLLNSAVKSKRKELYVLSESSHHIMRYLDGHPDARDIVFNKILEMIISS
jgi:esterase/lipase